MLSNCTLAIASEGSAMLQQHHEQDDLPFNFRISTTTICQDRLGTDLRRAQEAAEAGRVRIAPDLHGNLALERGGVDR
jgi:hypothetical protein